MSQLQRLHVSGIRSFGPDEDDLQKIRFFSPLTLIQGQNGCGKTTIIESLKYAITGELPGGSARGQGFVYDPNLAKNFETRGQIKLRVCDTLGEPVTVTKTVVVTKKANETLAFKKMDSVISRNKGEKHRHVNSKCNDADDEMCRCLGVSKAILSNVIFCHQEDSNWPLEEGKKLKERFDEIFDATRYQKCMGMMGKLYKEKYSSLKILSLELSAMEETKAIVYAKHENLKEKQKRYDELIEGISEKKLELKSIDENLQAELKKEQNYNKIVTGITIVQKTIQNLVDSQNELLVNLKEFPGTDDELNEKITKFEHDLESLQTDIDLLQRKKHEYEEQEVDVQKKLNECQKKLGTYQAEIAQNDNKTEIRNKLVLEANFGRNCDDLNTNIVEIISQMNEKAEGEKREVKQLEKKLESEENALQNATDSIRVEFAKIKQNIFLKKKSVSESKVDLKKLQQELDELNSAGQRLQISDKKIQRFEQDIKFLESSVNVEELRAQIIGEKNVQKDLEDKLSTVDSEIKILQEFTSLQTEIDLKNENLITRENDVKKLKIKHEKALKQIFSNEIPNEFKTGVLNYRNLQNKLVKDLNTQIVKKGHEVLKLESNLQKVQEKFTEKQQELDEYQKKTNVFCKNRSLEEILEEKLAAIKEMQNNRGIYYSSKYIYQKYIQDFMGEAPCCPVCERASEKDFAAKIVEKLTKKIENFPGEILRLDAELKAENSKYETLLGLKPIGVKIKLLNEELPTLKNSLESCETNLKKCTCELEKLQESVKVPQENEKIVNPLIGDVALMDQLTKDVQGLKREISSLSVRMPKTSTRGMQEALSDQETFKNDLKVSRNKLESFQNKLSAHIDRLQRLKEQKNALIGEQLALKQSLQGKDNLLEKIVEIEKKIVELEESIVELEKQEKVAGKNLEKSMAEKEQLGRKNREKMDEARRALNALQKKFHTIVDLQNEIEKFAKRNIPQKIEQINSEIILGKGKLEDWTVKKAKIDGKVDTLKSEIADSRVNFRMLEDNVKLREKRKQKTQAETDLRNMKKELGKDDVTTVREEKNRLLELESDLREKISKAEGKKTELRDTIIEMQTELSERRNANILERHKKKFIQFKIQELAASDLRKFIRGMEFAVMQFHKLKMVRVNEIIKELWRAIYKGNDIDHIAIKTEDIISVGLNKRKVYNYKIVQSKNDTEIDMRGRCSAGQRVLASLVIRIALSETFSINCGILTLDEPTTNLDRENIHSLCEALVELINQKKKHRNFQLVIITHDQDFVDRLTRSESLEQYYIIQRNEAGKSVISLKK